jgi:hypothetical protein
MNWFPNLANSLPTYLWLTLSAGFFAVGEYFSKKFALHPDWKGLLLVCSMYLLGSLAWLPALFRTNQLAATGTAWLLLSMLATLGIGFGVFHEKISSINAGGIALAAIALMLLNYQN